MGETELVLDGMAVDEVLAIIGGTRETGGGRREEREPRRAVERERPLERGPSPDRDAPASSVETPRVSFSGPGVGDWREALRAAGAAPSSAKPAASPPPPPPSANAPAMSPRETVPPLDPAKIPLGDGVAAAALAALAKEVAACTKCPLYATATNPVPGEGNPNADLMCVGEAPGASEDELGRPFVGAAGQLLTKILAAVNLAREAVYICNVLKHRPPGNRNPAPDEVTACSPYLVRQIEIVKPKVIIAWGTFAAQTLLDTKTSIGKLRGQVHTYYGVPLIVTYHPAALLRNPAWKRPTWEDVQLARRILDSSSAGA
jgi:DNA polymerase